MRVATCAVCGGRLNLLREKLITAEWVDGQSGALVSMHFHSPCFVRWYGETASARAEPEGGTAAARTKEPQPEDFLSEQERARLRELRGRREGGDEGAGPGAPGGSGPGG